MLQHRTVGDLMTWNVVRVGPATPFKEIARTLAEHDITAVPVVDDDGRVVGVVSEADLMRKPAGRPDPCGRAPAPHLEAWQRAKSEATRAEELMSAPPVCARPDWNVVETARLMTVQGIKRLPVVDGTDKLVGIISRADVLRVFLREDSAIGAEIRHDLLEETLGLAPSDVAVSVCEGQVTLTGTVASPGMIPLVEHLSRSVDGVVSVRQDITCRTQDTASGARVR